MPQPTMDAGEMPVTGVFVAPGHSALVIGTI